MSTFRTSLRIVAAHRVYILIYLFLLSMLGLLTGPHGDSTSVAVDEKPPTVAVIDHDGSTVSQGLTRYVESTGEVVPLDDSRRAMQDATAQDRIQYILVIPAGYGDDFTAAARNGSQAPALDTVVSYQSAAGSLMDVRTNAYLGQVRDHLSAVPGGTPDQAVAMADETVAHSTRAELIASDSTPLPGGLVVFAQFSTYPLFAFATVSISTLMTALGRRPVRSRTDSSPVSGLARSMGVLGACLVVGTAGWVWVLGLGIGVFAHPGTGSPAPLLGIVGAALFAYELVAVATGFLLGQLGLGENAVNAIANILGMVLSFVAGAWVPVEFMPDALVSAARITPGYWANRAITGAAKTTSPDAHALAPLLGDCGLCALFALAILVVGLTVGRSRSRASL